MTSIYAVEYKECSHVWLNSKFESTTYKGKTPQAVVSQLPNSIFIPFTGNSGQKYYYTYTNPIYSSSNGTFDEYTFTVKTKACVVISGKDGFCAAYPDTTDEFKCEKAPIPQAQLSFTPAPGQTEPRPKGSEGANGKSTYDLVAKVIEGAKPKAGMALTFTVEVEAGSGGLPTIPAGRPAGDLSIKSGTTDAKGEVKVRFTSPMFAGTHTVKVKCAKCTSAKTAEKIFNVKVPNLISLPADSRWEFTSTDNYHKNNNASAATRTVYYVTEQAKTNLGQMVDALQKTPLDKTGKRFWGKVGLNDASLKWGGKFNAYVKKDGVYPTYPWDRKGQHGEHRLGVQIDLQTRLKSKEDSFVIYDRVCKPKPDQYKVVPTILFHTGGSYHFHAYLLGNIDVKLGGGNCRTMND